MMRRRALKYIITFVTVVGALTSYIIWTQRAITNQYTNAEIALESGNYKEAKTLYGDLGNYSDAKEKSILADNYIKYNDAVRLFEKGNYEDAAAIFLKLGSFENSEDYYIKCSFARVAKVQEETYIEALELYRNKSFTSAYKKFEEIRDYKDSEKYITILNYAETVSTGMRYSIAISEDDYRLKVYSNEYNLSPITKWADIVSVSSMGTVVLALDDNCHVRGYSTSTDKEIDEVNEWKDVVQIDTGEQFGVGLQYDGKIKIVGRRSDGISKAETWDEIRQVSAGRRFIVALNNNNELLIAGHNEKALIEEYKRASKNWRKKIKKISAGGGAGVNQMGHVAVLFADGTIDYFGDAFENKNTLTESYLDIACGDNHLVILDINHKVFSIGDNGAILNRDEKTCYDLWNNIIEINAGLGATIGVTDGGVARYRGNDKQGQDGIDGEKGILVYSLKM